MPEAIAGNVAGAVVGGLMGGDSQGGTQTMSKEPWEAAAPWLKQNIQTGQDLQAFYQNSPFNALQQQAYAQLLGQNNYVQSALPGLLQQFSQHSGYDMANPSGRSAPIRFPQMGLLQQQGGGMGGGNAGLLGDMNATMNPFRNGGIPAPAPAAAPAATNSPPPWFDPLRQMKGGYGAYAAPDIGAGA